MLLAGRLAASSENRFPIVPVCDPGPPSLFPVEEPNHQWIGAQQISDKYLTNLVKREIVTPTHLDTAYWW